MSDDLTINASCDRCRGFRLDLIVEQDETGWVTTRRPTPEHAAEHELADDLVLHSAAAMTIALDASDWQQANENFDRVLRLNDDR